MSDITVEVKNIREVDKGALKAFFSIGVFPDGVFMNNCRYFVQGGQSWMSFPQEKTPTQEGNKDKYYSIAGYFDRQKQEVVKNEALKKLKSLISEGKNESKESPPAAGKIQDDSSPVWF